MNRAIILIVDDELEILHLLKKFLNDEDFEVFYAQNGRSALDTIQQQRIDVVVTDIRMPGMDGLELLRRIKRIDDLIEVIVLTGYASIEAAVNSMKHDGAFDFLTKPIENFDNLLISVQKALSHRQLRAENVNLLKTLQESELRYRSFVENFKGITCRLHHRKLDAIATLAGGVAHEFNNALAGLMGNIELLEIDLGPGEKFGHYFHNMMKLSRRMSTLTQQLLAYARGGKYNPCEIELGQLIKGSLELVRHRLPPEIELEVDMAARQDLVNVDTAQLEMVLLALYDNAVEALEKGGRIHISTKEVRFTVEDIVEYPNRRPGPYVCLIVKDNGCGMSKETESKIFDPFFTTKFVGRGLGLSAAYGIVANHAGWITASTERGYGTEICVYLPLLALKETEPSQKTLPQKAAVGDATLLVVDDEPIVMDVTCTLLEKMNYRVLRAETGGGALEALRASRMPVDLVLLDVGLPDLEADVVYQELRKIQPGIRVLVWSGNDKRGPVQDLLDAGADDFLQKPFSQARLIEKVLSVLGHQRQPTAGPDKSKGSRENNAGHTYLSGCS